MKKYFVCTLICLLFISCVDKEKDKTKFGLVIHGGAGVISNIPAEKEKEYIAKLNEAIEEGYKILEQGGNSLDAVETVIKILEDCLLFNAGKGAVFNSDGINELDASIMDGATLNAGAITGVRRIKNPILLARLVMEKSVHVLFTGEGAEKFAQEMGIDLIDPEYFYTEERWKSLEKAKEKEGQTQVSDKNFIYGTVGCVALDKNGNLAAGTSTGGMTNKKFGRVGDSPIIGAGTYANNKTCAVSCTGHGEYFIKNCVAYDVSALMEYKRMSLKDAAEYIINNKLKNQNADGGLIGIDKFGNVTMPFNTSGMFRGYKLSDGKREVKIYKD
ncbi:MAG: isoaspartyl peptidase/L-asparaginase [Ignavibacteriales bacterium]|nr:isoaspartyl peptidase/L-asparaginase [Ignavibacteriales bacterium]